MTDETIKNAVTIGAEFVERMASAVLDGTPAGNAAADFVREKKDVLIGLSVGALRDVLAPLSQAAGSHSAILSARRRFIDSMTFDEALAFQESSVVALEKHASEKFRAGSLFETLGKVAQNIAPKLLSFVLSVI